MKAKTFIILFVALIITGFFFLTNLFLRDSVNTGFSNKLPENTPMYGGVKAQAYEKTI